MPNVRAQPPAWCPALDHGARSCQSQKTFNSDVGKGTLRMRCAEPSYLVTASSSMLRLAARENNNMTVQPHVFWVCILASASFAAGCKKQTDAPPDKAQPSTTEPNKPVADAPPAQTSGQPHCVDFLTDAVVSSLALKPQANNHEMIVSRQHAVRCAYEGVSANIWLGDQFATIVAGVKAAGANSGVDIEEGPAIGAQTLWTTLPAIHGPDGKPPHTVNFSTANKKFTGGVSGTDKARVEQVAAALAARFEKM